jgi:hypothetical protein
MHRWFKHQWFKNRLFKSQTIGGSVTEKEGKKQVIAAVPALLTGTAALVAALTTTYVSLRDGKPAESAKKQVEAAATDANATTQNGAAALTATTIASPSVSNSANVGTTTVSTSSNAQRPLLFSVEKIAVHRDGTSGTTNWRFAVEVNDEPRFAFEQQRLTDEGGRNIAFPKDAATKLNLPVGKPAKIVVKAWKTSAFHAVAEQPDAQGEGRLDAEGKAEAIQVSAADLDKGSFTFYFTAADPVLNEAAVPSNTAVVSSQ